MPACRLWQCSGLLSIWTAESLLVLLLLDGCYLVGGLLLGHLHVGHQLLVGSLFRPVHCAEVAEARKSRLMPALCLLAACGRRRCSGLLSSWTAEYLLVLLLLDGCYLLAGLLLGHLHVAHQVM
jgi:hypothetical protein